MKFKSISSKLLMFNICLLGVILSLFIIGVYYAVSIVLTGSIDRRLVEAANFERRRYVNTAPFLNQPTGRPSRTQEQPVQSRSSQRFYRLTTVFDVDGNQVLLQSGPDTAFPVFDKPTFLKAIKTGRGQFTTIKNPDKDDGHPTLLRVYYEPLAGETNKVIQAVVSYDETAQATRSLFTLLIILLPVGLVLAYMAGYFFTHRTLTPINEICDEAKHLNPEDLSLRLPVNGTDEFAELSTTINEMLTKVEAGYKQLEESYKREKRFTADVSHELRTPLTALKAQSSLAKSCDMSIDEYQEAIEIIDSSANKTITIINDLLLLARSDSGQTILTIGEVEVAELIDDVISTLPIAKENYNLKISISEYVSQLMGDYTSLYRLFTNLLTNALKYTKEGGDITVNIFPNESADKIIFEIEDTGIGIPKEDLEHITDRFYRVDRARTNNNVGGSIGLGLSICKSIVLAHNGCMRFESEQGKGTKVTVTLPINNTNLEKGND